MATKKTKDTPKIKKSKIGFDDDFIYQEIPLPITERQIPTEQLAQEAGAAVFNLWAEKSDKTEY